MVAFKSKHKRSDWFKGLLDTEKIYKNGGYFKHEDDYALWFKDNEYDACLVCFRKEKVEYCRGVKDYIKHLGRLKH